MAYWQMGDRDQAQIWYKRGVASMYRDAVNPGGSYMTPRCGYYMQAAELMGLKVKHFDRKAPATGIQLADGDEDGLLEHSEDSRDMWLSQQGRTEGRLEFDLKEVHELGSMLVWNYNERGHTQRGIRRADISVWNAESG